MFACFTRSRKTSSKLFFIAFLAVACFSSGTTAAIIFAQPINSYAGTFTINLSAGHNDTFPGYGEEDVSTILTNPEYKPENLHYSYNGVSFRYSLSGTDKNCSPLADTFNSNTITFKETSKLTDNSESIPLFTVSATNNRNSTIKSFALSATQTGFELKPNTEYSLRLKPNATIKCDKGNYMLSDQVVLKFKTGEDEIAPYLFEPKVEMTSNAARVTWKTNDRTATTQVKYGKSGHEFTIPANEDPQKYLRPYALLKNLQTDTEYFYEIISTDPYGNVTNLTGKFKTWRIGQVSVQDITGHEASINWQTNPATSTFIEYGTSTQLGQIAGGSKSTNHQIRLLNLTSKTTYYFRIVLENGDAKSTSSIHNFSTLDASAGWPITDPPIRPEFDTRFDMSEFNFLDFPLEELEASSSAEASGGAVLASTDEDGVSLAGNFDRLAHHHPWVIWLLIPILILITAISIVWLLWRHEKRMSGLKAKARL